MFFIHSINEGSAENPTAVHGNSGKGADHNNISNAIAKLEASMENRFVEMDAPNHWANFDYVRDESQTKPDVVTVEMDTSNKNSDSEKVATEKTHKQG